MYEAKKVICTRDFERDENGHIIDKDNGFFLLKYEIDDKYDIAIYARSDDEKEDSKNESVKPEIESIAVTTTVRYHDKRFPRMTRRFKQKTDPTVEQISIVGDIRKQLLTQIEFLDVMEYAEDNIVAKVFNIVFNEEEENRRIAEESMKEYFKKIYGDLYDEIFGDDSED
ncbi:hypothetical protein SAMN02910369_01655 [Lachnospiraceae bacterium NE2001]|nr:hypothetical protein SAMN02910369_01655 [Lachnospiraceae bacterium NE2001]